MSIAEKYQLSAERFTWELYDANWRDRFGHWQTAVSAQEIANVFVGWCYAARLLVRPRVDEYAIMCEINGEKFWFHHLPYMLESILEEVEKQTNNNKQEESK